MTRDVTRREALGALGAAAAGVDAGAARRVAEPTTRPRAASRLKQSVSRWCYGRIPLDDLCEAAKAIGYRSVELLERERTGRSPKKHGLDCAMANGFGTIPVGFNRPDNHDKLVADARADDSARRRRGRAEHRRASAAIARGMSDGEGIANCIAGLKRVTPTGRAARRHALPRAAEQQSRSQGLPGRPHRVGRAGRAGRRVAAPQAAVRHLPHADHGRRRHRDDSRQRRSTSRTTTPAACRAAPRSTTRRSSTIAA